MVCSSVNDVSEYTRTVRSAHAVATMGSVGCGAVCQVRAVDTGCSVARGEIVSVGAELSGCCGGGIFFPPFLSGGPTGRWVGSGISRASAGEKGGKLARDCFLVVWGDGRVVGSRLGLLYGN